MKFSSSVVLTLLLAALVLCVSPGISAENGLTHEFKIGVVNTKKVFDNYEKQKVEYEKLRKAKDKAQKPIDELSDQITMDKEHYDAEKDKMDDDERPALEDKIQAALTRYRAHHEHA